MVFMARIDETCLTFELLEFLMTRMKLVMMMSNLIGMKVVKEVERNMNIVLIVMKKRRNSSWDEVRDGKNSRMKGLEHQRLSCVDVT